MSSDGAHTNTEEDEGRGILGNVAVTSLLQRCTQVGSKIGPIKTQTTLILGYV